MQSSKRRSGLQNILTIRHVAGHANVVSLPTDDEGPRGVPRIKGAVFVIYILLQFNYEYIYEEIILVNAVSLESVLAKFLIWQIDLVLLCGTP